MKKKDSVIIFELNKQVKPKNVFAALRRWRKLSKKKFKYETIIKNSDIVLIHIKPPRPKPPTPPMIPTDIIKEFGFHKSKGINQYVQLIQPK